ncbi:hypothetical protein J7M07_04575 [bacterium]|nr:hypothetical protein [bacterium]
MKKVLMIALALIFVAGTASATTYVGLFNSATEHANANASYFGAGPFFYVYVWVNADAEGFKTFEFHIDDGGSGDMVLGSPVFTVAPSISVGGPFDVANGWKATWYPADCVTGWNMIASFQVYLIMSAAHEYNIVDNPISNGHDYITCGEVMHPLAVMTVPFGVNMEGVPAEESSWGAVKSIYR